VSALIGAVLVVLAGAVVAGCGGPDATSRTAPTVLRFQTVNVRRDVEDNGAPGPSQSDSIDVEGEVLQGGRVTGRFDLSTVITDVDATRERGVAEMVITWNEGSRLILGDAVDYPVGGGVPRTLEQIVLGGTHRYFAARGVCNVRFDGARFHWTCRIVK
jgi:hypothetical protein